MTSANDQVHRQEEFDRRRLVLLLLAQFLFVAQLMFLTAGDLGWRKGWLFLLVCLVVNAVAVPYVCRVNPELVVARSRLRWAKRWDIVLSSIMLATVTAIFLVAALDDGRFHWLPIPWWLCGIGYLIFLFGMGLATWVGAVNRFAEGPVRIQTERGHTVIDTGPYAIVRHPGYVAAFFLFVGTALSLGSLWALIPVGLTVALLILRTYWEDQTLQAELAGYKEYTAKVRHKLIPGVW